MDSRGHTEGTDVMATDETTDDVADLIGSVYGTLLLRIANAPGRVFRVSDDDHAAAFWLYDRGMIVPEHGHNNYRLSFRGAQALVLLVDAIRLADAGDR